MVKNIVDVVLNIKRKKTMIFLSSTSHVFKFSKNILRESHH